jgi:cell division protein FtsL
MVKMLICLSSALGLAVMVLQLRQQRLELNYKISQLHRQIESNQSKLWNQQLQIAMYTAPNAIQHTVNNHDLKLVPRAPVSRGSGASASVGPNWLADPDAE